MTDSIQTFVDLTVEELVTAARLVGVPAPGLLFDEFTPPGETVLAQMEGIGRRSLRARGFLETTVSGALTLDENVAVAGDLLGAHGIFAMVVNGGTEGSLSWVLADDSNAAVLTGIEKGLWRLRFIEPEAVVASLLLLVDLDQQGEATADRAEPISLPLPSSSLVESGRTARERAVQALEATADGDRVGVEALVGTAPDVHSVIVGLRKDDGSIHRGAVTWTSDEGVGCTLIEMGEDSIALAPTTPDLIATKVYDLVGS